MVVSTVQAADEGCSLTGLPRRPREMGHAGGCPSKTNNRAAARALVQQHLVKIGRDAAPPGSQASGANAPFPDTKAALAAKNRTATARHPYL
jgi:hypothetical protein